MNREKSSEVAGSAPARHSLLKDIFGLRWQTSTPGQQSNRIPLPGELHAEGSRTSSSLALRRWNGYSAGQLHIHLLRDSGTGTERGERRLQPRWTSGSCG